AVLARRLRSVGVASAHRETMVAARTTPPATTLCSPTHLRFGCDPRRPRVARHGLALLVTMTRCGASPSVNVLGSFFPAWLICIVTGVVLTIITLRLFVAMEVASDLGPTPVVYPCLAGLWTFATWLLVFGG